MTASKRASDWKLLSSATAMAFIYHRDQMRKGTSVPYMSHLFAVTGIVMEHGGSEPTAAAAMLHDAAEDQGGEQVLQAIEERLGANVALIVRQCSDSLTQPKPPWRERKEKVLDSLSDLLPASCLVKAADTLHNLRSMHREYQQQGEPFWEKFRGGRDGTLWFYENLARRIATRVEPGLRSELLTAIENLLRIVE